MVFLEVHKLLCSEVKIALNQLAKDLHSFFKYSVNCIQDYFEKDSLTCKGNICCDTYQQGGSVFKMHLLEEPKSYNDLPDISIRLVKSNINQ